ncbi:cytochrome C assembly protein [archaeon SCG-AAA382B04]|nr:cytochrome C assembly protein [archaeon SCG-AAA382B04]
MEKEKALGILSLIAISTLIVISFLIKSPFFQQNGDIYRMLFFHVPLAWIAYLAFFIVMISSIFYLKKEDRKYDNYAAASAEIGVIFAALTLITGSIWARAEWGVWWRWDPRLTTTLVTWIIYVAYLTLRGSLSEERKARLSAVYGIIAFISVPISYLSITISLHPQPITGGGGISSTIANGLIVGVIAYTILYTYILRIRKNTFESHDEVQMIEKNRRRTNTE